MRNLKCVFCLLFAFVVLCGCNNPKQYLSGNPSEILDVDTYNELQKKYLTIKDFQDGTAVVKMKKYGLIDCDGKEILPCEYDSIYKLKKEFRIIIKDSLYGAVNKEGAIIKQCIYKNAYDAGSIYLVMEMNDKWGFIDNTGKDITQYKYEQVDDYNDSTFIAKYNGYYGVCDYSQNILIPFKYDRVYFSWEKKCPVTFVVSGEFYGLYNSRYKQVLECKYGLIMPNSDGLITIGTKAQSYKDVRKALVEAETGKIVIPFDYMDMGDYSEGLVCAQNLEEKWGYLDKTGKVVIPFVYDNAGNFSEGLAAVYRFKGYMNTIMGKVPSHLCGYIDKKGKTVIPFQFQENIVIAVSEFHNGLAVQGVGKNNLYALVFGYINKRGEWVVKPKFDEAECFENGVAEVAINNHYGYINTKGEQIIPCEYDKSGGTFVNDSTIELKKAENSYYFNLQGKTVPNPNE